MDLIVDAVQSRKYKNHRDYVRAMFRYFHKKDIDMDKFTELVFDYKRDGEVIVTAHKDMYREARD